MQATTARRHPRPARGFTLIEIVVVLFIVGIVIAMAAAITTALSASQRLSTTTTRMQTVDAAIVQFVMQQKRLPCPADGTLVSTDASAGTEGPRNAAGCTGNETAGVVPWRALALSETDATDGWNRRLTYRVQPALGADSALDMSWCDPAGTGPLVAGVCNNTPGSCSSSTPANCTPPATYLTGKGLQIRNVAGTIIMEPNPVVGAPPTGAAYVVISVGSSGGGAYMSSGQLSSTTTTDGTEEKKNYANLAYAAGVYYVDDGISDVAGATHFDDIVSRPAILTVANKAGLAPRSH
jgi:prepilin-type N-terminal cleavage/methylation domain-containing protein